MVKINNQLVQRLKMNEIAMNNGYENFIEALKTGDDTNIYITLSEVLGWIANSHEWHIKVNQKFSVDIKSSPEGCLLLGIRHANNMIKHNFNFLHEHVLFYQTTIPQTVPFYMEAEYRWIVAGKEFEGEFPNQKRNYDKYLT